LQVTDERRIILNVVQNNFAMPTPAPSTRRDRKRLQTLEHLARTAGGLFERHGYEAVTMEQIAGAADVAKGTLYNHFPVKEAVLAHWLHLEMAANLAALHRQLEGKRGFVAGLGFVLRHSADWCEAHPDYLAPYLRYRFLGIGAEPSPSRDSEELSDIVDTFAWLVRRGQHDGEIRADVEARRLALAFHHLYLAAMLHWLASPRSKLRKEFDAAVELFLHGAAAPGLARPAAKRAARSRKKSP
jgi:AcrR family transcriptional regulator